MKVAAACQRGFGWSPGLINSLLFRQNAGTRDLEISHMRSRWQAGGLQRQVCSS